MHGTSQEKADSICESGFTYFGKHGYFTGKGSKGSTDIGYFGSGIYFTDSAAYATMYSQRVLLFSWVSMREPYPIVNDKPHPHAGSDMTMLEGKGAYKNYDAHFAPVASIMPNEPYCMDYYPCYGKQKSAWNEIVVFQKAQALPCFIIELSEDLVHSPYSNYSFISCYAACQAGNLPQVEAWVTENKNCLQEVDMEGENFLFAAILGNQLPLLKWLYIQDPTLLKKCRKDGWTLMHVAAAEGHAEIVTWLNKLDPLMIKSGKITPLQVAAYCEQTDVLALFLQEIKENIRLIEEIVQRPCPKTLTYLLDNGLNPNQANSFKQTLLHLAAYKGQSSNITILLQKAAQINAQDLSKKTALYIATVQGHLTTVISLLEKGADPTILGVEGDTILHVAAFYGYTPLLQALLNNPLVKKLLSSADEDGKQPIHKAVWGHAKPDVVQLLLDNGADPKAINKYNYTPLHWAAKHGHIASAEILIKAGALVNASNLSHDLPFDLALRWGQDELVHFFLGTKKKIKIEEIPKDVEAHYYKQLLQAKRENLAEEQVFYLEKLSDHYLEKKNWVNAAKLLNCAVAILEKSLDNPSFQTYLLKRLERIEALFLESKRFKVSFSYRDSVTTSRTWLQKMREACTINLKQSIPLEQISPQLTNEYRKLLRLLIQNCQEQLGPPPTKWACVGMGSMARNEMCPYSDLEFAFLIEKKTEETLKYFRTLTELLELRIINLGETKFPVFAQLFGEKSNQASPTPGGFSMDSGGNTPLGKPNFYELIDTPNGLARYQCIEWMEADIIVTNALSTTCHIAGDERLARSYTIAKEDALNKTDGFFSFTGIAFRNKLALKLLKGNLQEYKPDLSKTKQEENAFGIKKELYRPLQSMLGVLTLYCGLELQSTFGMIQQLLKQGILSSKGAANLTRALNQILALRFEAHIFYKNEEEFLLQIEQEVPQDPHFLYLDEKHLKTLHDIYMVLIPLQNCGEKFLETEDITIFAKSTFYDDSPLVKGKAFSQTLQYASAQKAFQNAVSLNPNNIEAQGKLGEIEEKMGHSKEALSKLLKMLALAQQKFGENHPEVGSCYTNLSMVYNNLGEPKKALEYCEKALKIHIPIFGENHSVIAVIYNNMGLVYKSLGNYKKSLEFHQKGLQIQIKRLGENHLDVATSFNNLGGIYEKLGDSKKAIENLEKALQIKLQLLGENHPDVAASYSNIGLAYNNFGESKKALELHNKALEMRLKILGENHPHVAASYNNIGLTHYYFKEFDKALEFYNKSLNISLKAVGENHPDVAECYDNIGIVYSALGESKKALEFHQKALGIELLVFGENHPSVANSYNSIGETYKELKEFNTALEFHQKALKIRRQLLGEHHLNVAQSYNNIGAVYKILGKYDKVVDFFQKALDIAFQVLGDNHPAVAISCSDLGMIYFDLGEFNKAIEFHQKALKIQLSVKGENLDVAETYNELGLSYDKLRNHKKANECYKKSLNIKILNLGENHPDVASSYNNLGVTLKSLGELNEAIIFYEKSLKIRLILLGSNHPDVARSYYNIGLVYGNIPAYDKALECFEKALKIWLLAPEENKLLIGQVYNDIGAIYNLFKEYDKALEFLQKSLQIRLLILGKNHPDMASSYNNLGNVYCDLENYDKSLESFQEALRIWLTAYGKNHPSIQTVTENLFLVAEEASPPQIKALGELSLLYNQIFGIQHPLAERLAKLVNS